MDLNKQSHLTALTLTLMWSTFRHRKPYPTVNMSRAAYRRFQRSLAKARKCTLPVTRARLTEMRDELVQRDALTEHEYEKLGNELHKLFQELKEKYGDL